MARLSPQVFPCGNINPVGITGTPVVDLASRSLFFDALIDGTTKKHFIYSLNVDTGATNSGWPVDVNATATYNGITFVFAGAGRTRWTGSGERDRVRVLLRIQRRLRRISRLGCGRSTSTILRTCMPGRRQRLAVASGDTAALPATALTCSSSQETLLTLAATGCGGEAIIRLQAGPTWTGQPTDYWTPTNWFSLDNSDTDLGGVSATVIDVPGATPSQLVLALGKDSNAYLLNRNNLGGITSPVAQANVSGNQQRDISCNLPHQPGNIFCFS